MAPKASLLGASCQPKCGVIARVGKARGGCMSCSAPWEGEAHSPYSILWLQVASSWQRGGKCVSPPPKFESLRLLPLPLEEELQRETLLE